MKREQKPYLITVFKRNTPTLMPFPPQTALVRRTDVILRATYPQLQTRIFEIADFVYRIVFDKAAANADTIRDAFEQGIRPVTLRIDISNDMPAQFVREIQPIADHELSKGLSGLPLTRDDIRTVLAGKHPNLPELVSIGPADFSGQRLRFPRQLTPNEQDSVRTFFEEWEPGWPIDFAIATAAKSSDNDSPKIPGDILQIRPAIGRSKAPSFVQDDEAFWFDHIDAIFEGATSPDRLTDAHNAGMACYLDASMFSQIDLRQAVLCYDTVYMSPPIIEQKGSSFWEEQATTRDDVLALVADGRLKLILRQPEERTDPDFLAAAYAVNPTAIIGRRKAAAIIATDLVRTADEYRLGDNDAVANLPELARLLAPALQAAESEIVQLLAWPNAARRECLLPLMTKGLMSLGAFGPGRLLGQQLQRLTGRDLQLEALVTSDGVHVAHTLNATFIPPIDDIEGWIWPRRIVGDRLNFYKSFNTRIAAVWAASERQREEKVRVLPPVPLFKFGRHAKMSDIMRVSSHESDRRKARGLVARLAKLPADERQAEIDRLSLELYEYGVRRGRRALTFDTLDDVKELGMAVAGISIPPIPSAWRLVRTLIEVGRNVPALDRFIDDLENDLGLRRNEDIHFLSKIERVAELRLAQEPSPRGK